MAGLNDLDKTKKMILFVGVPIFVTILIVGLVLIVNMFGSDETPASEYDPFARLSLETVDAKPQEIMDKSDGYKFHHEDSIRQLRDTTIDLDKYAKRRIEDSIRQAEDKKKRDDLFRQLGLADEDSEQPITDNQVPVFEEKQDKQVAINEPKTATKKATSSGSGKSKKSSGTVKKQEKQQDEDDGYGYYGFGAGNISSGNSNSSQQQSSQSAKKKKVLKENKFFEAFLIQNTTMKNKSQVTFILNEDVTLNGIRFKKMSRIFGVCSFSTNTVNIRTTTIQNTDGKKYPLSLDAYNENYQKGIYVSGIEEVLNEGSTETQDELIDEMNPNSAISVVNTGIKGAAKTIKKATKREQQIQMNEGYKMYFPIEEEEE